MLKIKFKKKVSLEEAFGGELSQEIQDALENARNLITNGDFKKLEDLTNTVSASKEEEGYRERDKRVFYDFVEYHLGSVTGADFKIPDAVRDPNKNAEIYLDKTGHLKGMNELDSEGKLHGKSLLYWDGVLRAEGNYLHGKLRGWSRGYDKEGRLKHSYYWKNGNHHGPIEYFEDGERTLVYYKINGRRASQLEFEKYCRENPDDPVCKPTETPSEL